jgi:glycosyltransferase involved in cell wall biosynthesis
VDRIVDGFRPDVIYAHGTVVNGALGLGPARRHGIPLVCHDHDHAEIRDCERLPARRRHFRAVAGGADALLVVNSQMVKMVSRVAPELRPQILPEGADIRPDPPTAHRTPGLAVFCASTFTARKQIPLLIEAFAQVAVAHPGARLRIAGDGPERPQVEERIARHGLQERVELLGFVDPDRVLAEMHQADVFALLSRDEPFATVYCEAMAARLPIVCTADGGITDAVRDGVHGRVVGPNDSTAAAEAINGLLADPAARRQMGEAGRQLVGSELTWDANARRAGDLFAQIVARRRTREGPSSRRDA